MAMLLQVESLTYAEHNVTSALGMAMPPAFNSSYFSSGAAATAARTSAKSDLSASGSTVLGVWDLFSNFGRSLNKLLPTSLSLNSSN